MRIARTVADLDAAVADDGPPAAVLHFEGAEAIDTDLESLVLWYERRAALAGAGLEPAEPVRPRRAVHLAVVAGHRPRPDSRRSAAGHPLRGARHPRRPQPPQRGRASGTSPAWRPGRWWPPTRPRTQLCATSRNLTDAQLDAIGATGGLVGIVFAVPFLRPDFSEDPDTPVELIARHAAYVAERIGVDHVALGSDFDGAPIPAAVGDVAGVPRVLDALAEAGFSDDEMDQIAWGNWRRVLDAWWN